MNESQDLRKPIGTIVAEDYRTAEVFRKYGIDFCCGGKEPLETVCRQKDIDPGTILREIEAVKTEPIRRSENYDAWDLSFLADYIINNHHGYLRENMGGIASYTRKIAEVHGPHHPEVVTIAAIFDQVVKELTAHTLEEEEVFFPAVKRVEAARKSGAEPPRKDREMIRSVLAQLDREHQAVGDAVHEIRHLSNDFAIPDDVCNTFIVTYHKLKEFEEDLHKHVHLENNILFPKAGAL